MGTEVVVPGVANLGATLGAILALAVFLWRVFGKRLDAIVTRLDKVDENFEKMEAKFDGRFDKVDENFEKMEAKFEGRFDKVDGRFDKVDSRFDKVDGRFDKVDRRFDKVDGRLNAIDVSVGKLEAQFEGLQRQFVTLDGKVDDLAKDHRRFANELSEFRGEMHGRLGTVMPQDLGVAGPPG